MKILLNDIKSARWAIIAIIAYFALFRKIFYTICPMVLITGFPCPGCGMTRASICLLHFDFKGAWAMHPFIYVIGILVVWFAVSRYFLNGKSMKGLKCAVFVAAVAMVVFYIWRMKNFYPDVEPMIYYPGNCLNKLIRLFRKF